MDSSWPHDLSLGILGPVGMINFQCPSCSAKCSLDDKFRGRKIRCPKCKTRIRHHENGAIELLSIGPGPVSKPTAPKPQPAAATSDPVAKTTEPLAPKPESAAPKPEPPPSNPSPSDNPTSEDDEDTQPIPI